VSTPSLHHPTGHRPAGQTIPILEARHITKYYGSVVALRDVSLQVRAGEVTCVLGDNGAGKSTLIKILSGVFPPDEGEILLDGQPIRFTGPRDARARGIATVYQDLAMVPMMSVWRNFFLGQEPTWTIGPFKLLDVRRAKALMRDQMASLGIQLADPNQSVSTLSGGERQAAAVARAVYFGARVLILDEPTSALGVRESGIVLRYVAQAREMGRAVILITHNPHHAYPVGDQFVILRLGRVAGQYRKSEINITELMHMMAGGEELAALDQELQAIGASRTEGEGGVERAEDQETTAE
jgi:simple sugar transport system ATP-binding protein